MKECTHIPTELCELLEANSRINASDIDLSKADYETDVLIIGGGAAGISVASRLRRKLDKAEITLVDPADKHF